MRSRELPPLPGAGGAPVPARGPARCAPAFAKKQERNAGRPKGGGRDKKRGASPPSMLGSICSSRGSLLLCALVCEKTGEKYRQSEGGGHGEKRGSLLLSGTSPRSGKRRPRRDQSAPSSHCPLFSSERKRAGQVICRPARPLPGMGSQKMRVSGRPCGRKRGYCAETAARRASTRSVFSQGTFRSSLPRWP